MPSDPTKQSHRAHPGAGRRNAPPFPKGRVVDPEVQDEIQRLLGDRPLVEIC